MPVLANVSFLVYMHYKEYCKSSNTGKIVEKVITNSEVFIHGLPEDTGKLLARINEATCVLYLNDSAVEFEEWKQTLGPDANLQFILLDSCWAQAKKLNKTIPLEVPRVKLTPSSLSKFRSKTQKKTPGLCTAECAGLVLKLLGLEAHTALYTAFALKDKANLRQRNRRALVEALEQRGHY